jgi:hypothetical protein
MDQMNINVENSESTIVLSRYLYVISEVKASYISSILSLDLEESLFWGYEIYFSGFERDAFEVLSDIYDTHYSSLFPELGTECRRMFLVWIEDNSIYEILGTLIKNIILTPSMVDSLDTMFDNMSVSTTSNMQISDNISLQIPECICMRRDDITPYLTISYPPFQAWKVMHSACRFAIRRDAVNKYDPHWCVEEGVARKHAYLNNWVFYASFSPIWQTRLINSGASRNIDLCEISFNENEVLCDNFHRSYDLAPREQCIEIQKLSIIV